MSYSYLLYVLERVKAVSYDAKNFRTQQLPSNTEEGSRRLYDACLRLYKDGLIRLVRREETSDNVYFHWRANV